MKQQILVYGPELRVKSLPVTEFDDKLREFASNLIHAMREHSGLGLAAVQLSPPNATPPRIFAISKYAEPNKHLEADFVCINPRIIEVDGEQNALEGCLSFPGLRAHVTRPMEVYFSYQDVEGEEHRMVAQGLLARAVHHEYDHLEGVVFTDRMSPLWRDLTLRKLDKMKRRVERNANG